MIIDNGYKKINTGSQGWRTIGGTKKYFRSKWEANYARYLQFLLGQNLIAEWLHEPETFWFEGIKRGVCSYLPDFKVTNNNGSIQYVEVKGFYDAKTITKLKRMKKYFPKINVTLVDSAFFKTNNKILRNIIREWE